MKQRGAQLLETTEVAKQEGLVKGKKERKHRNKYRIIKHINRHVGNVH